ncbi:IclR family transcriptional regulator [Pseudonocardia oroxyli]|nr:IclR family transcriptional regulator [Pseudonocardia oroxyli]
MTTDERPSAKGRRRSAVSGRDVDDTQFSVTVAKAFLILEAFSAGGRSLGNAELLERTGLPKPTISRLTYTLMRCGYLVFDQRHRVYELGPRSLQLGAVATSRMSIPKIARPKMEELGELGFNVGLGLCDGDHMLYIDAVEAKSLIGLRLYAGSRMPVATTAMGLAYLASLSPGERAEKIAFLKESSDPEVWTQTARGIERALAEYADRGYCSSLGEWRRDIHGVAAAIRGRETFVINIGGPAYQMPEDLVHESLGPAVASVAQQITGYLEDASDAMGGPAI